MVKGKTAKAGAEGSETALGEGKGKDGGKAKTYKARRAQRMLRLGRDEVRTTMLKNRPAPWKSDWKTERYNEPSGRKGGKGSKGGGGGKGKGGGQELATHIHV